jgi:alkanesulfonate monooxygenase SsuD/methylene tetrahydromethanopterin reductase-like flavin-dependent oxidoreductase (luciferase family)
MDFTLTYPLLHHPSPPDLFTGAAVAEVARAAEAAGFDALAFTEHPMPSDRWLNAGGHDASTPSSPSPGRRRTAPGSAC